MSIQENVAENSLGKRKFSECLIWEEEEIPILFEGFFIMW